jgi:Domain of unknown function (DUF4276)
MVDFLVVIEGGGTSRAEQTPLRKGFTALFEKLRKGKAKPKIVCAGGRSEAFKDFKTAVESNPRAICLLLVDSEGPVAPSSSPWEHVARRRGDGWQRPAGATDEQLHFMVETMEAWLVADPDALATYYGSEFKKAKLPRRKNLEEVSKTDVMTALLASTEPARTKGKYEKSHGFDLVGKIDPGKVRVACPEFAERFFRVLETL